MKYAPRAVAKRRKKWGIVEGGNGEVPKLSIAKEPDMGILLVLVVFFAVYLFTAEALSGIR